jgi:putative flippase GtrA
MERRMTDPQASSRRANGRSPSERTARWHWDLVRYLVIGGFSVIVDVGLLALLHESFGVSIAIATTAAFGTSLVVNFLLNRIAMSSSGSRGLTRHALRYASLVVANYVITLVVVTTAASVGGQYLVAKLAVVAASTVWNFLLYRHWVFTPPPSSRVTSYTPDRTRRIGEHAGYRDGVSIEPSRLLVVIPAFNEEESVGQVVAEVRACLPDAGVLVVDDASSDGTRECALEGGAMVLTLPFNLGVGGALRAGFRFALRNGFGPVLQIDGDGQHDPEDAHLLISALDDADVVIGARFAGQGSYDVRGPRRWAMRLLASALSKIARTDLTDTTSGFRATSPRAIELFARHYPAEYLGDTVESIVICARAGMVIRQVPVTMRVRAGGQQSQTTFRATLYLLRACLAVVVAGMKRRPPPMHEPTDSRVAMIGRMP